MTKIHIPQIVDSDPEQTLRDTFALAVLPRTLRYVMNADPEDSITSRVAILCYQLADAMMAERSRR